LISCPKCLSEEVTFTNFFLKKDELVKVYYCRGCKKPFYVPADILAPKRKKRSNRRECRNCGDTENYHAKGLCNKCYARELRKRKERVGKC